MRLLKVTGLAMAVMLVVVLLLPALIVRGCRRDVVPPSADVDPQIIRVWNHRTEEVMELPLGEYLLGVVAAEMPADFHMEALKAQAIIARTYAIKRLDIAGGSGCDLHGVDVDICTDHNHAQAWMSKEDALDRWPFFRQNHYWGKIVRAVSETKGMVVAYDGKFIDALYHSTCGGHTENSEDVWSNPFPYLRGVECDFCSHSPHMSETVRMGEAEVAERLEVPLSQLRLSVQSTSDTGRIISIDVGNRVIRGLEFRTLLGLKSSRVSVLKEQGGFSFTTTGYGHAVGLCQYGADGMARQGYNAQDILRYYYTDVHVSRVRLEE